MLVLERGADELGAQFVNGHDAQGFLASLSGPGVFDDLGGDFGAFAEAGDGDLFGDGGEDFVVGGGGGGGGDLEGEFDGALGEAFEVGGGIIGRGGIGLGGGEGEDAVAVAVVRECICE